MGDWLGPSWIVGIVKALRIGLPGVYSDHLRSWPAHSPIWQSKPLPFASLGDVASVRPRVQSWTIAWLLAEVTEDAEMSEVDYMTIQFEQVTSSRSCPVIPCRRISPLRLRGRLPEGSSEPSPFSSIACTRPLVTPTGMRRSPT